jgi:cbb3-type cytochrome oxidase cytochrome c subunit
MFKFKWQMARIGPGFCRAGDYSAGKWFLQSLISGLQAFPSHAVALVLLFLYCRLFIAA